MANRNPENQGIIDVELGDVTRSKFLNYAVSVITSRALPDVRDGLKPVQRRILYTMAHDLKLTPEKSTLKCAKVVGQVLGNYHPHGDGAVYEALVRLAQPWTLRYPLIFGQGNFGSIDGDSPAAYRYTEARPTAIAMEFVHEIGQETVEYRKNFDDSQDEPVVLPAKVPQLLINGCTGIAVGVATNIPPHNISEICLACEALVDDRDIDPDRLLDHVQGPDFPTGGEILESKAEMLKLYREGHGKIRMRGQFTLEDTRKGPQLIICSLPYQTNKAELVEAIADLIINRKIPQLLDVRDESSDEIRVVLECKRDCDLNAIKAFLFKHTALQSSFHVNMTCLVEEFPGKKDTAMVPARLGLKEVLLHFLDFRHLVVTRRLQYDLRILLQRIHILQGFDIVFQNLDDALHIIRNADGRQDAALKLINRFNIDQDQADAVLDLRLYRIGKTDILDIRQELSEKMQSKVMLEATLANPQRIWGLVKREIREMRTLYGDARRSLILESGAEELSYAAEDFIVEEEVLIVLTRDGWIRRLSSNTDLAKLKLRQDDEVASVLRGTTRNTLAFFTNLGAAYTLKTHDIPISPRGFGEPVQKYFSFNDGERVVGAHLLLPGGEDQNALICMSDGKGFRAALTPYRDPSTKNGRRFAKPEGSEVIQVIQTTPEDDLALFVTRDGMGLLCKMEEISLLSGAGRGVGLIKLQENDRLIGSAVLANHLGQLYVARAESGKVLSVGSAQGPRGSQLDFKLEVIGRANKGSALIKRGQLVWVSQTQAAQDAEKSEDAKS
jgi:DNA gyrase subunit A